MLADKSKKKDESGESRSEDKVDYLNCGSVVIRGNMYHANNGMFHLSSRVFYSTNSYMQSSLCPATKINNILCTLL